MSQIAENSATRLRRGNHSSCQYGGRIRSIGVKVATHLTIVCFAFIVVSFLFSGSVNGQFTDLPGANSSPSSSTASSFQPKKKSGPIVKSAVPLPAVPSAQKTSRTKPSKIENFQDVFQIPHKERKTQAPRRVAKRTDLKNKIKSSALPDSPSNQEPKSRQRGELTFANQPQMGFNPVNENRVQKRVDNGFKPKVAERNPTQINTIRQVIRKQDDSYKPWWQEQLTQKALGKNKELTYRISVDQLVMSMLQYSPEIRALQQEPAIASTYIDEENSKFDPVTFLETKWEDSNEPVGNILTTNNSPFLKDHIVTSKGGFRKRSQVGTQLELSQNLGFKNSNSEFFLPQDQGTARLVLNIDQPLLNGAGRMVGTSRIILAQIDSGISETQYAEKLQNKILGVVRAYWEFYFQKSVLILRQQNYDAAVEILRQLKGRESFDAQRSQIIRAEAAVAARKLDLIRSRTDVRNAETVLRELTRDPRLGKLGISNPVELIPTEFPNVDNSIYPDLPAIVSVAFHNRPEIDQAMQKLRAASIQHDVSKNQLLPQLNFIFNMYAAALNGETGVLKAWNRQFVDTTPGYSAGIVLEYPIYNRAALARKRRVEAQLTKLSSELDDTLGSISAEVEIAHRELKLALEATAESRKSVEAAERDQAFIQKRWKNFAFLQNPDFASPTIFLEQLLDAQDRIAQAQAQYANATRQFMVAIAELRKAEGSLLNYEQLTPTEFTMEESNLPEIAPLSDTSQRGQ